MSEVVETGPGARFVRKEREHLDVLHQRLDFLRSDSWEDPAGHIPGEPGALAWALDIIEGSVEPIEVRMERYEQRLRVLGSKVARLEKELREQAEEAEDY